MSTLTAEEKRELVRAKQSEISSFHETSRCSSCHAVRCASHGTLANEMGDHTKTRFKSGSSFGSFDIHRSAVSKTHCITDGVTTWSRTLKNCIVNLAAA